MTETDRTNRRLRLPRRILTAMRDHARRSPRAEVCGLLGGRGNTGVSYYPVANIAEDPARAYLMEPKEQIAAMRDMRERGESLLGIFHSHPDSTAEPSSTDLAKAEYPDTIYIVAGPGGEEMRLRTFYYDGAAFTPIKTNLIDHD